MRQRWRSSAPGGPAGDPGDRPLGELFRELASESGDLVRQEIRLASTELRRSVARVGGEARRVGVGASLALVGLLTLTAFAVVLLGRALGDSYWLSALILGVVLAGAGAWMVLRALRSMRGLDLAPRETLDTLRGTQRWAVAEASELRALLLGGGADGAHHADGNGNGNGRDRRDLAPPAARLDRGAVPTSPATPMVTPAAVERVPSGAKPSGPRVDGGGKRGKLAFLKLVLKEISDDDVMSMAAKVAYFAFLALPPAFLVLFGLAGFFGGPGLADWLTVRLESALPTEASDLVDDFVMQVVHEKAPGPFSIGLVLALWASSNVFMALGDTLNRAFDIEERRSWIKQRLISLGMMLAGVVLLLSASVVLIAGPRIADALNLWGAAAVAWNILHWPLAFLFVASAFFLVYYVLPNRDQRAQKLALFKGAVAAALLWLLATAGFRFYINNFGSYSETYGLLGTVTVLLLWLYVTGLVVLAGGELASELEDRAEQA